MDILIFIVVLVVLILVHEAGHFFVAKITGMRVDEFGLGYPPRLYGVKFGETTYTINAIPFGGFVRIHGEEDIGKGKKNAENGAFISKSRISQAAVLLAGVTMNMLLAWILITGVIAVGTPRGLSKAEIQKANNLQLVVTDVMPSSPAADAGIVSGDVITGLSTSGGSWGGYDVDKFTKFIEKDAGAQLKILVTRNNKEITLNASPKKGLVKSSPNSYILGVGVSTIGVLPMSLGDALYKGTVITWKITEATAYGLGSFFLKAATFSADLSQISGPVGIAGAVGAAANSGIVSLFTLVAVISINLAIINLIPIPALDGGRLLFVIIEAVTRRAIKPRIAQVLNLAGFGFIILLMVVVTVHDIYKIVG